MIPFWKKTGKHSKPQSAQKRRQNAKPAMPRTAQQSIPMQRMFEDGTCRVKPNYYTRTIQYQDINYQLAQQEDKTAIFEEFHRTEHLVADQLAVLTGERIAVHKQLRVKPNQNVSHIKNNIFYHEYTLPVLPVGL